MKIFPVQAVLLFVATVFVSIMSPSTIQAAPGDFMRQWGAQQHFQDPQAIALDHDGNMYVTDIGANSSVQVFDRDGQRLRKWGSYGSGDGQFSFPLGIAVDRYGNVFVTELVNNRVQVFDSNGHFLRKWGTSGTGDGELDAPFGIAVDGNGNVYVADANNSRIQVFDANGNFIRKWGTFGDGDGQFNFPTGLAIDGSGHILVTDSANFRVQVFENNGIFLRKWGSLGEGDGEFASPNALTTDGYGHVFVVDANNSRVEVFGNSGTFQLKWGTFGEENGQFNGPLGIVAATTGEVYVVDGNNARVQIFDGSGAFLRKWWSHGAGDGEFNGPNETAIDADGNVFVVDTNNHRVEVFTAAGTFLRTWGSLGDGDGQFNNPLGIAIDSSGKVYVADSMNNRIEVFDRDGNFLRKFGVGILDTPSGVAIDAGNNAFVADTGNSMVQVFDSSGNFLRQWGGFFDEHLGIPNSIAVDRNGNVYVTDSANQRIDIFDSYGNFLSAMGEGEVKFPRGIAVDARGHIFVASRENDSISVFDDKGVLLARWGGSGDADGLFNGPLGVAVDKAEGNVYVADTGNNRIQVLEGYGLPQLPTPWATRNIGFAGIAGSATYLNGTFSVTGAGSDIWGRRDGFNFVYQSLRGDGQIIARVTSVQNSDQWAKAGVMIRETLGADSRHALMALTPGNGAAFQRRSTTGAYSLHTGRSGVMAPYWVKLVRSGNKFSGYVSSNGVNWVLVGSDTIKMDVSVLIGMAVTSHDSSKFCLATLTEVKVEEGLHPTVTINTPVAGASFAAPANILITAAVSPGTGATVSRIDFYAGTALIGSTTTCPHSFTWKNVPAGSHSLTARITDSMNRIALSNTVGITVFASTALSSPWVTRDIGSVGVTGNATYQNGSFTLEGAGSDIWSTGDSFRYVYKPLTGDGQIIARVASQEYTNAWAKAGVMIRESLTNNSRHALMALTPGKGAVFQRRLTSGGTSLNTTGPRVTSPYWVRLVRSGNTVSGYTSKDGVNWVFVGRDTITMAGTVYVGLAVTSHDSAVLSTAILDAVSVN